MYQLSILKSIILYEDVATYLKLQTNYKNVFTDEDALSLFKVLRDLNSRNGVPPSVDFIKEFFKIEKETRAKKTFNKLMSDETITIVDTPSGLVDLQLTLYARNKITDLLKDYTAKVKLSSGSDTREILDSLIDDVSEISKNASEESIQSEGLIYHDCNSTESNEIKQMLISKYDLKKSGSEGYYKMDFGIPQIDSVVGGIHSVSFIAIMGFVKNGKSFFARQIAYNALCQGKNVVFISLEMSFDSVLDSFLSLHANNSKFFGVDSPKIKTADIRSGTLSRTAEDFYKNQVIDSFTSDDSMGTLYIKQPTTSKYTPTQLFSDVRMIQKTKMSIDLLVIDYPGRMSPDSGAKGRDTMNELFLQIRNFGLANHIPIVFPVQCNRAGFDAALKSKGNLFSIDAIGDYSSIEKEATDVFSILTTDEMRSAGQSQIQHLISRESGLAPAFKVNSDFETGVFSPITSLSAEDSEQLIDEINI